MINKLYKLAVAFEKASQAAPTVPSGGYYNPKKPMDEKVLRMQQHLINLGFPLPSKGADGIWGPETQAALDGFKKQFKLMNASPDIVSKRLEEEANKKMFATMGLPTENKSTENQLAFNNKTTTPNQNKEVKDLVENSRAMFVDPNSGNFTPLR